LREFAGPDIEAPDIETAREWCRENAGYLEVIGEYVADFDPNINFLLSWQFGEA